MQVAAMDHGVGIAEAGAELVTEVDVGDLAVGDGVHQAEAVDIDRHPASRLAHAEAIEAVEGIGPKLDAGADLAQLGRLLQDQRGDAFLGQRQCGREATDATTSDENFTLVHQRPFHHAAGQSRAPAGRG